MMAIPFDGRQIHFIRAHIQPSVEYCVLNVFFLLPSGFGAMFTLTVLFIIDSTQNKNSLSSDKCLHKHANHGKVVLSKDCPCNIVYFMQTSGSRFSLWRHETWKSKHKLNISFLSWWIKKCSKAYILLKKCKRCTIIIVSW